MTGRVPGRGLAIVAALLSLPAVSQAQVRASERGGVMQRVDGTTIEVEYGRPQARGRDHLFGGVVHWGEVWTPGANWATTIAFDRDVIVGGRDVEAGTYSVWLVPAEDGNWALQLNDTPRRFHTRRPAPDEMVVSVPVTPEASEHYEVLTFHFPEVERDRTRLHFHWGTTQVAVEIRVHPTEVGLLTPEEIAPYLGDYDLTMFGDAGEALFTAPTELIDAAGRLRAIVDDGEFAFQLIPSTDEEDVFYFGFLQGGEVVDVEEGPIHFDVTDGRATGFTVYGIGVDVWMKAARR